MVWIGVSVLLSVILLILFLYLKGIKRQLRELIVELQKTERQDYNRQLTVTLFDRDVTELAVQMNRNLDYQKQLKLQAEQSERTLRQSTSDIAHDLRTPLTVLRGNLQMMEREGGLSEENRKRLQICQGRAAGLGEMVDDFFEMSVLESENIELALEKVNVTKVLTEFIVAHEMLIREKELEPEIRLPEKTILIRADEKLLLRMLENLLGNVMKYAGDSFELRLEEEETGKCKIVFANHVEREQAAVLDTAQLFRRTYRGNPARSGGGAGLGLYIVKLLAEKQGAAVEAVKTEETLSIIVIFEMI